MKKFISILCFLLISTGVIYNYNVFTPTTQTPTFPPSPPLPTNDSIASLQPIDLAEPLSIEEEVDNLTTTCLDHIRAIYGGSSNDECEINEAIISLVEQYDVEPYNPPVKQDCYEVVEEVPGTGTTFTSLESPYARGPTSYSIADSQSLIDSAKDDPRAALEVAQRSKIKKQAIGWLIHAAAISPDSQKASGSLMRAANSFSPSTNIETGKISMEVLVQRIAFEEMAAERGNPIARPSIWWNGLEERFPETIERTRLAVDVLKTTLEKSLVERRSNAGLPNA